MVPVVTPEEMRAVDRAAPESVEVLIGRAGAAVARHALDLLGGAYGRRVVVLAGKGNNGADGRDAARRLRARGVRVVEVDAGLVASGGVDRSALPERLPAADLVIDAAYGTGFRGKFDAPVLAGDGTPVLAVDIPSGVDGLTGEAYGRVLSATRTVTFAAGKPGLYLGDGPALAGEVVVADIGLDVSCAQAHVIDLDDVFAWLPAAPRDTHKWKAAVWVIAGSPGMAGAATLTCSGAQRAGAGYVRLSSPGGLGAALAIVPVEVVHRDLAADDWAGAVTGDDAGLDRFAAVAIGNGLGRAAGTAEQVRAVVAATAARAIPTVVDADGLLAFVPPPDFSEDKWSTIDHLSPEETSEKSGGWSGAASGGGVILTPHDGEFRALTGDPPGPDRLAAARQLAATTSATVLLKGSTTVVADPAGHVLLTMAGDSRLATAGTGDVLAGMIAAFCARGLDPWRAAAAAACVHQRAAALGWRQGLVAGDVAALVPIVLDHRRSTPS